MIYFFIFFNKIYFYAIYYVVVSVTKTTIADEPEVGGLRQAYR